MKHRVWIKRKDRIKQRYWVGQKLKNYGSQIVRQRIRKDLVLLKNKESYAVGLGTIDVGIQGNEPILSLENLEKDLNFCKSGGFNKAIIFRLGGLNKEYIKVLNNFI